MVPPAGVRAANDRLVRAFRVEAKLMRRVEDGLLADAFQERLDEATSSPVLRDAARALRNLGYRVP